MKKLDWLTLFVWPALAVIILLSLLVFPLLLPDKSPLPTGPFAAAADVKYAIRNGQKTIVSEEIAEIRALYSPDLFASSRSNRLSVSQSATNRSDPKDIIPSENPLLLSFLPASNETGAEWFAMTGRTIDNYGADPGFRPHSPGRASPLANKPAGNAMRSIAGRHPKLSIELKGELKHFSIDPNIFQDIALPAGRKPWSPSAPPQAGKPWFVQAELRFNAEGRVEHVFAESIDCEPPIYQEIVKRLYQCHFSNVTQTCEGTIIISYPAYSAANSNNPVDIR